MQQQDTTAQNRRNLIKYVKGIPVTYTIEFSVDIKGNVTIWGGEQNAEHEQNDLFIRKPTEQYLWLYDGWNRGAELSRMELEQAQNMPREVLIQHLLDFRKQHPHDGYGAWHIIKRKWCSGYPQDDFRAERDDEEEVKLELRKRNRQYIAELYGEQLPVDFDFYADYNARLGNKKQ